MQVEEGSPDATPKAVEPQQSPPSVVPVLPPSATATPQPPVPVPDGDSPEPGRDGSQDGDEDLMLTLSDTTDSGDEPRAGWSVRRRMRRRRIRDRRRVRYLDVNDAGNEEYSEVMWSEATFSMLMGFVSFFIGFGYIAYKLFSNFYDLDKSDFSVVRFVFLDLLAGLIFLALGVLLEIIAFLRYRTASMEYVDSMGSLHFEHRALCAMKLCRCRLPLFRATVPYHEVASISFSRQRTFGHVFFCRKRAHDWIVTVKLHQGAGSIMGSETLRRVTEQGPADTVPLVGRRRSHWKPLCGCSPCCRRLVLGSVGEIKISQMRDRKRQQALCDTLSYVLQCRRASCWNSPSRRDRSLEGGLAMRRAISVRRFGGSASPHQENNGNETPYPPASPIQELTEFVINSPREAHPDGRGFEGLRLPSSDQPASL